MSLRTRIRDVLDGIDHPRLTAIAAFGLVLVLVGYVLRSISAWGSRAVSVGAILLLYAVTGFVAFAVYEYVDFE